MHEHLRERWTLTAIALDCEKQTTREGRCARSQIKHWHALAWTIYTEQNAAGIQALSYPNLDLREVKR
jgi:hypothetical protein